MGLGKDRCPSHPFISSTPFETRIQGPHYYKDQSIMIKGEAIGSVVIPLHHHGMKIGRSKRNMRWGLWVRVEAKEEA